MAVKYPQWSLCPIPTVEHAFKGLPCSKLPNTWVPTYWPCLNDARQDWPVQQWSRRFFQSRKDTAPEGSAACSILVARWSRLKALPGIRESPHCASLWSMVCSNATFVHGVTNIPNQFHGCCRGVENRWLQLWIHVAKGNRCTGRGKQTYGSEKTYIMSSSSLFLLTSFRAPHVREDAAAAAAKVYMAFKWKIWDATWDDCLLTWVQWRLEDHERITTWKLFKNRTWKHYTWVEVQPSCWD